MSSRRKLLSFVVKVVIVIVIMAPIWVMVVPGYNHALAVSADKVTPSSIGFRTEDNSILIDSQQGETGVTLTVHGLSLQYGLVVLLALIIATPGLKIRKRLKFIIIALVAMFIIHVIGMVVIGILARSISPEHPSVAGNPLYILIASIGFDLFPILVWLGLSFKYWLPLSNGSTRTIPQNRISTVNSSMAR